MNLKNFTLIDLDNLNLDLRGKIKRASKKLLSWIGFQLLLGARPILQIYLQATQNLYSNLEEAIAVRKEARRKKEESVQEETEAEDKPLERPSSTNTLEELSESQNMDLEERQRLGASLGSLQKA